MHQGESKGVGSGREQGGSIRERVQREREWGGGGKNGDQGAKTECAPGERWGPEWRSLRSQAADRRTLPQTENVKAPCIKTAHSQTPKPKDFSKPHRAPSTYQNKPDPERSPLPYHLVLRALSTVSLLPYHLLLRALSTVSPLPYHFVLSTVSVRKCSMCHSYITALQGRHIETVTAKCELGLLSAEDIAWSSSR